MPIIQTGGICAVSDGVARLVIHNTIADLAKIVAFVEQFGADHRIPQATINDVNLCLDELLNNTITYGYADQQPHEIVVTLRLAAGRLAVKIEDDAAPFDPTKISAEIPAGTLQSRAPGGVGLLFVKALVDEMRYRRVRGRNALTLIARS